LRSELEGTPSFDPGAKTNTFLFSESSAAPIQQNSYAVLHSNHIVSDQLEK
jgi:hypothetical protein